MSQKFTKGELEIMLQALAYYYGSDDIFDLDEYGSAFDKINALIKEMT